MTPTELKIWAILAVFAVAIDNTLYYRKLSGKMGERVRAYYQGAVNRMPGGIYTMVAFGLLFDILLAPFALAYLWLAWSRDWRWYQEELKHNN